MSKFGDRGVRCDWCGKFSKNRIGEYTKPDGISAGYIIQPTWERYHEIDSENDICEECAGGLCPYCGSSELVRVTPTAPGPDGWGHRCKDCGKGWTIPTRE